MGGRARPSPIRPQRLAQGHLEVALWSSGALGRILARVLNSESRERANRGAGFRVVQAGRGLLCRHGGGQSGHTLSASAGLLVRRTKRYKTPRHEGKTYCPPDPSLAGLKKSLARQVQGCQVQVRAAAAGAATGVNPAETSCRADSAPRDCLGSARDADNPDEKQTPAEQPPQSPARHLARRPGTLGPRLRRPAIDLNPTRRRDSARRHPQKTF